VRCLSKYLESSSQGVPTDSMHIAIRTSEAAKYSQRKQGVERKQQKDARPISTERFDWWLFPATCSRTGGVCPAWQHQASRSKKSRRRSSDHLRKMPSGLN
jgi:hypothetical protein